MLLPFYRKIKFSKDSEGWWFAGYSPVGRPHIVLPACPAPTIFHALWVWVKEHPLVNKYRRYKWKNSAKGKEFIKQLKQMEAAYGIDTKTNEGS